MSTPADAVSTPAAAADGPELMESTDQTKVAEEVKKLWGEYATANTFDFNARRQYARDRRYAAGTADVSYAVDANLLGSYIDILVSYIYARNPKVSVRPAEQVEVAYQPPIDPTDPMAAIERFQDSEARRKTNTERQAFAKTLQIVVSKLWEEGKLKKCMKKVVRSGFAVGIGWFKAALLFETQTDPQVQTAINDLRDNMQRVAKLKQDLATGESEDPSATPEDVQRDLDEEMRGLEERVEIILRKAMAIDFVSAEHMQVALDVRDIDDHCEASWNANAMFKTKADARATFPNVTDEQWKQATLYFQREPTNYQAVTALSGDATSVEIDPKGDAFQYTKVTSADGQSLMRAVGDGGKPVEFVKVVELWDRRVNHVKTMIEGLKLWPRDAFVPRFATSRFYPYFQTQFFPVDGDRHPQSMSWRLAKLQDEYANSRSSFRLTRQRSIPATIFNSAQIDDENAKKLKDATQAEYIAIELTEPERAIGDAFAAKPIPTIDPGLFDNSMIVGDMEKLSGVQEALQTSQTMQKTATQAEIEQGGFAARSTAERDCVEETLSDFAVYTAEVALQGLTHKEVQQIAGHLAFWPEQMPIQAITQWLNVDIEAGSTGRPNTNQERQSWVELLPLVKETIGEILAARAANQEAIAQVYIELLRETFNRFDDRIDVDRFIPALPPVPPIMSAGAAPGAPGGGGGAPPGGPPSPGEPPAIPGTDPEKAPSALNQPGNVDPLAAAA